MTGNWCLKTSLGSEIRFNQVYMKPFSNSLTFFDHIRHLTNFLTHSLQTQTILSEKRPGILGKVHCNATTKGRQGEMYQKGKSERFKA